MQHIFCFSEVHAESDSAIGGYDHLAYLCVCVCVCVCVYFRLQDGGALVMSTMNRTPLSYSVAILGAEYITRVVPTGTHDWERFVTPGKQLFFVHPLPSFCQTAWFEGTYPTHVFGSGGRDFQSIPPIAMHSHPLYMLTPLSLLCVADTSCHHLSSSSSPWKHTFSSLLSQSNERVLQGGTSLAELQPTACPC